MANTVRAINCKSCDRILATVLSIGLVPAELASSQGCDTCQPFTALYDAMQAADEEYAPLEKKGDKHRGKQIAVAKVNKTHMDFDNWLMGVEAPVKPNAEQEDGGEEEERGEDEPTRETAGQQQGIKRARSHSPNPQQFGVDDTGNGTPGNQQLQQQTPSIPHRPSSKRSHSTRSLPERKRLKFSDSVEFRDDYRSYLTLGRSSEEYAPGRYAPPEGGYLDTSGADQSFPKFTGLKKVRGTWVEVKEKHDLGGNKGTKIAAELQALGDSDGAATTQEQEVDSERGRDVEDDTELDSRSARLARRTRRSSDLGAIQKSDNAAGRTIAVARRGRGEALDGTLDEGQSTSSDTAAARKTTEAEKDDRLVDIATSVAGDVGASDQTLNGDIGEDQDLAVEETHDNGCKEPVQHPDEDS